MKHAVEHAHFVANQPMPTKRPWMAEVSA